MTIEEIFREVGKLYLENIHLKEEILKKEELLRSIEPKPPQAETVETKDT